MKTTLSPESKQPEVADIFRLYGADYRQSKSLSYGQIQVMRHIKECRTAVLGGHVERCNTCSFERIAYNSCPADIFTWSLLYPMISTRLSWAIENKL